MVTTSSLTHTPTTFTLLISTTLLSILASALDIKHLLPLKPTPHLYPYLQLSRLLTFQLAYTSATELLVSVFLLYQFRVLERLWGSRKYASFLIVCFGFNVVFVPFLCLFMKGATVGWWNYLPSGATAVVWAGLAAWRSEVPELGRYKVLTGGGGEGANAKGVVLSDKSTTYLLAAQLALSQFPYQLVPAVVGWAVGSAWVGDLLPGGLGRWRVPAWVVGESGRTKSRGQYEGLRRRLEEEGGANDGMRNVTDQALRHEQDERRGGWRSITGYFTGS